MNHKILVSLIAVSSLSTLSNVSAFQNGDVINFKPGEIACVADLGVPPNCQYGSEV